MRKLILTMISIALPVVGLSAQGYGDAGCGLGSVIFGNKPGAVQILAVTTNATFYSQLFGITSGTSNCRGIFASAKAEQNRYAEANYESLKQDIARGEGEKLRNFASLFGCYGESSQYFADFAQGHYELLFEGSANGVQVVERLSNLARRDGVLSQSCTYLN